MNATMTPQQLRDLRKATTKTSTKLADILREWDEILNEEILHTTFTYETMYVLAKQMSDLADTLKACVRANVPEEETDSETDSEDDETDSDLDVMECLRCKKTLTETNRACPSSLCMMCVMGRE